jgi:hypothetical protein
LWTFILLLCVCGLEEKGLRVCAVWEKDKCNDGEKVAYLGAFAKV